MAYKLITAEASPSTQKAIQLAFPAPDWEVTAFDNGLELTKMIFEVHPDALLVSLSLPGLDGYSVGRFVRKQEEFRHTALVFLKGTFEPFDAQRAEGVDFDDVVAKPFDSAKLAMRMKNLIDAKGEHSRFPESPIPAEPAAPPAAAATPTPTPAPTPEAPLTLTSPTPASIPQAAPTPADAELERRIQEVLRRELVGMEREVEKRVRLQITVELKKWFAEHYIGLPSKDK